MATWKKIVVSGSAISQLNNDAGYLIADSSAVSLTGSFTGSFAGDGSNLTGVVASNANALTQGAGIDTFSYDGSSAGVTVSVDSGSLAGNGITTSGGAFVVQASDSTITVGAGGISVSEANLSGIPNSALSNNSITFGSTAVALGDTVSQLSLTGFTGSFSGSFVGTTDLPDLVSGNGLTGGPYDGSTTATFAVSASGTTLDVSANGVKVADGGITGTQLASSVAGAGLAGGAGSALSVNVDDSSIEIATDTLRVKAGGISNAMIAAGAVTSASIAADAIVGSVHISASSITGAEIANDAVALGTQTTGDYVAALGSGTGVTIGSNSGEGSNPTIAVDYGSTANTAVQGNTSLTIQGTANEVEVSGGSITLGSGGTATIGLPNDVTINQDLIVNRNLTVAGTASFQHTEDLDVADKFIRLNSGSTSTSPGGIAIQQTGPTDSEAFAWSSTDSRWGVTGSFDPSGNTISPDVFMAAVIEGAANDPTAVVAKYTKKGNIFVANNEDIYIYS
jgi:hypothetical protein